MIYPLNDGQALTGRVSLRMSHDGAREHAKSEEVQMIVAQCSVCVLALFCLLEQAEHVAKGVRMRAQH